MDDDLLVFRRAALVVRGHLRPTDREVCRRPRPETESRRPEFSSTPSEGQPTLAGTRPRRLVARLRQPINQKPLEDGARLRGPSWRSRRSSRASRAQRGQASARPAVGDDPKPSTRHGPVSP